MAKKEKKFQIREIFTTDSGGFTDKRAPVIHKSHAELFQALITAIRNEDARQFNYLLTSDFIYEGDGSLDENGPFGHRSQGFFSSYPYKGSYQGGHHTKTWTYEYYTTRPLLESFFFDNHPLFCQLVAAVAHSPQFNIHTAFLDCCEEQEVPFRQQFTPWDNDRLQAISDTIDAMTYYGLKTSTDPAQAARYKHASELSISLHQHLQCRPMQNDSVQSKMQWLHYKLQFINELHSKDAYFINHLGWKRLIANLACLILIGIPNAINYAATGNWLFFNNTSSQGNVINVDAMVDTKTYKPDPIPEPPKDCRGKDFYYNPR